MNGTIALGATAGSRIKACVFRQFCFNQLVVYQTKCCGKEGRIRSLDAVNQQFGIHFGSPFVEEPEFHVQDLFVTRRGLSENGANQGNRRIPTFQ